MTIAHIEQIPQRNLQGVKLASLQHDAIHEQFWSAYNAMVDVVNALTAGTAGASVIGEIKEYAGSTLPAQYLWANGQIVSRSTYASLFSVIGTTYNIGGEGGSNFRVPNRIGRVGVGVNPMGGITNGSYTTRSLGVTYGAESNSYSPTITVNSASPTATPTGTITINAYSGTITATGTVSGSTGTGTTGSANANVELIVNPANPFAGVLELPFTATNSYTPIGTVSGSTGTGTTGSTAPTISGSGNIAISVSGSTGTGTSGTTSLSVISGGGNASSENKTGVGVSAPACITAAPDETHFDYMPCAGVTVDDFTVEISYDEIAAGLGVSPNGHSHSIPSLSVTATQSLAASSVASTLSVSSHTHSIPSLSVTGTFTATNSYTPTGTASLDCADLVGPTGGLSIDQTGHTHTVPSLSITATFTGTPVSISHTHTGTFSGNLLTLTHSHTGSSSAITASTLQPSIALNYIIRY